MRKNVMALICFIAVLLLTGCQNKQQDNSSGASQEKKMTSTSSNGDSLEETMKKMDTADILAMLVDLKIPEDEQHHNEKKSNSSKETNTQTDVSVSGEITDTENSANNNNVKGGYNSDEYPIRGNSQSGIYHVPGQNKYDEMADSEHLVLFKTEEEAIKEGYRKAKK